MKNLNDMKKLIHEDAVAHGWWEGDRPRAEVVALIHSEWSEALEAYRNGEQLLWYDGVDGTLDSDKPEGIEVELIDGCIRLLDAAEAWGLEVCEDFCEVIVGFKCRDWAQVTLPELVCLLHQQTCRIYSPTGIDGYDAYNISVCIAMVWAWLGSHDGNPEAALWTKFRYNRTRPYKHGGKII